MLTISRCSWRVTWLSSSFSPARRATSSFAAASSRRSTSTCDTHHVAIHQCATRRAGIGAARMRMRFGAGIPWRLRRGLVPRFLGGTPHRRSLRARHRYHGRSAPVQRNERSHGIRDGETVDPSSEGMASGGGVGQASRPSRLLVIVRSGRYPGREAQGRGRQSSAAWAYAPPDRSSAGSASDRHAPARRGP